MSWTIKYTAQARRDARKLSTVAHLQRKTEALLLLLAENPFQNPPPYEALRGDLVGACSRRINKQHRLVYSVDNDAREVRVLRMWTHYE